MTPIHQENAINDDVLGSRDQVSFWRDPRWDDLECLHATFVQHSYSPHTHDTYVFGVIQAGVELFRLNGAELAAVAGQSCAINPGDVHDGRPGDTGYCYRMFYPSVALISGLQEQRSERPSGQVNFPQATFSDPDVYHLLSAAHQTMEAAPDSLARDSAFIQAATLLIKRYGDVGPTEISIGHEAAAIARVCDYAEDNLDGDIDLTTLADQVGFSPYRLIRSFRRERGMTPHAWITARRVVRAKQLLAVGEMPVDVAGACGFFDQAHLSRHFKKLTGVTPGRYRAAFRC